VLNVTALLGRPSETDSLRYGRGSRLRSGAERRPVVVWNCTRRCNLACRHCYSDSDAHRHPEMTTEQAMAFIEDIAAFGCPALLLSGGEPLIRPDVFDLMGHARDRGLAVTISSNGTLIGEESARRIADLGVRYVGVSIDGIGAVHDAFRGRRGAFRRTIAGIRFLKEAGVRVGIRVTLTPTSIPSLGALFDLVEEERIDRACFYHLVPAGRGVQEVALDRETERAALERIFDWAEDLIERDVPVEVLTVDNYSDGAALYLRALREDADLAERIHDALSWNGGAGNASGRGLAAVDWEGRVRPDQFWGGPYMGNVCDRPLSEIWTDPGADLEALRTRRERLHGRCSECRFLDYCGGGLGSRSLAAAGDLDASDPGCVLSDLEVMGAAVAG
jgi:radical SAM protein with 4Fe4S-binding SPASM domain